MEINYNYSKKDQLNHPQKYQKTPFHGKNFLSEYKNLRKNKIFIKKTPIKVSFFFIKSHQERSNQKMF